MTSRTKARVISVVFFAAVAFWTLFYNYEEDRLFAAIPGRATFLSSHDAPGKRLDTIEKSVISRIVAGPEGASPFSTGPVKRLVRMFFGRKVIVARVPVFEMPSREVWVFSSWSGAANYLLRSGLARTFFKDLRKERLPDGTVYWVYGEGAEGLSFAVKGGILFGASGDEPVVLQEMSARIDAYPFRYESIAMSRMEDAAAMFPASKDFGWTLVPFEFSRDNLCWFSFQENQAGACLDLIVDKEIAGGKGISGVSAVSRAIGGDLIDIMLISSWPAVSGQLGAIAGGQTAKDVFAGFVQKVSGGEQRVFAGLLDDRFSGKIYKMKVPVLIGGIEVNQDADVMQEVFDLMDGLNASSGLGIIPVRVPADGHTIVAAGGSKMNFFGGITQRPALVLHNGWLLICSDMESLLLILQGAGAGGASGAARWEGVLAGKPEAVAGAFVDFPAADLAIGKIIAVYTLSLIVDGTVTVEKRKQLDRMRALVQTMSSIGDATVTVMPQGGSSRIQIVVGLDAE